MMFENPDNRKYLAVTIALTMFTLWACAIWLEQEKLGWTGALMIPFLIATAIWTGVGYDAETVFERDERREAKRKKVQTDA